MWTLSALERLGVDLRYAVRHLARSPTWTLVVVSTLALGIGANTAIFTLIDSMLFKPASWNRDNRLVWVASLATNSGRMSYADYITYRDQATTLTGVLAFGGSGVSVGSAHPQRVLSGFVSGNYFDVLGLRPVVGRTFRPDEDAETGGQPVVVLSHAFWTEQFAANPRVVNTVVAVNGQPFTIIGVAPPGFTGVAYANDAEHLWLPLAMHGTVMRTGAASPAASTSRWLRVVGRLRDDTSAAQAAAELRVIAQQSVPAGTQSDREKGTRVVPVRGGLNPWEQREMAPVFGLIAIVPLLVLLVACTNVANLLMSRNLSRSQEIAMRLAIGASRTRLVRLLLTESLVLALLSAVVGFAFSFGVIRLMMRFGDLPTDDLQLLTPDGRALIATTLLAIATTLVFGLAPALTVTKAALLPALKEEGGYDLGTWGALAAGVRRRPGRRVPGAAHCRGPLRAEPLEGPAGRSRVRSAWRRDGLLRHRPARLYPRAPRRVYQPVSRACACNSRGGVGRNDERLAAQRTDARGGRGDGRRRRRPRRRRWPASRPSISRRCACRSYAGGISLLPTHHKGRPSRLSTRPWLAACGRTWIPSASACVRRPARRSRGVKSSAWSVT